MVSIPSNVYIHQNVYGSSFYKFLPDDTSLYPCKGCVNCHKILHCIPVLDSKDMEGKYYEIMRRMTIVDHQEFIENQNFKPTRFHSITYSRLGYYNVSEPPNFCDKCNSCDCKDSCEMPINNYYEKTEFTAREITKEEYQAIMDEYSR